MKRITIVTVVLLGFISMITPNAGYSQGAGTETPATVEVATEMAPAPGNCGPQPEPIEFDSQLGPAIGAWPLFVVLPTQSGGAVIPMSKQQYSENPKLPHWWGMKIGWFIKDTYHGKVKLSGFNIADHSPVYFDIGTNETIPNPVINPNKPGGFVAGLQGWAFFPSILWISKAGCYTLSAEWDGGMWRQTVPAGYVEGW